MNPAQWLCRSDARQVSDLPLNDPSTLTVYDRGGSETLGRKKDLQSASLRLAAHQSGTAIGLVRRWPERILRRYVSQVCH